MKIARQFERRGPLWLPRYAAVFPCPVPGGARPHPAPRRPAPDSWPERRHPPLERFRRWRRRYRCAWSYVNGTSYEGSATSHTISLGFTPSAGSLLIVAAGFAGSGSSNTLSVSDNSSGPADSWTALFSSQQSWVNNGYTFQAWATNITSGTAPTSVTVSTSGSTAEYWYVVIGNYTSGPNPFVQDGTAVFTAGTSGAKSVSASFTTGSQAGDLLWSPLLLTGSQSSGPSVGSPFSVDTVSSNYLQDGADAGVSSGLSANTQYTASWSWGTSAWSCSAIIGFQPAAAFQPDEDYWAWQPPGAADPTVTVFG